MKHPYKSNKISKSSFIVLLAIFPIFSIVYSSCNKLQDDLDFSKIVKPTWNPKFAIPLVNSTLYLADFFEDSGNLNIITNPDQSLTFVYNSKNLISSSADDFINFPDQEFDFINTFDLPPILSGDFDTLKFVENYQFIPDTSNQRIDSIFLKNGQLVINGKTNLDRDEARLRIIIPDIRSIATNLPLTMEANINNPNGQQAWVYFDTTYKLEDYKILLNHPSDTAQNILTINLDIIIVGVDNPDLSPCEFHLNGSLLSLEFNKTYGYFGRYKLPFSDSLKISLFENVVSGGINIGENAAKLSFDITNSFGTPVTIVVDTLVAHSGVNAPYKVNIDLFGPGEPNIFNINSPGIIQVGETIETVVDFSDANFAEAFNISPRVLYYDLNAITNFYEDPTIQNFILDKSEITLNINLQFELFASIDGFTIEDTVHLDLNENTNTLENMLFRINLTNGFPINAAVQVYFADENYQILDSLITADNNILEGAPVSGAPYYRVTQAVNEITDITIHRPRLDNIVSAKYLLFRTTLSTTNESLVKIYEDYYIQIQLGVIAGINLTTEN